MSVVMTTEVVTKTVSTNLGPTCAHAQVDTSWETTTMNVLTPMNVSVTTVMVRVKTTVSTWTGPTTAHVTVLRVASLPVMGTRVRSRTCVLETRQDAPTVATVHRDEHIAPVQRVCSWGMIGRRVRMWMSVGWGHRVKEGVSTLLAHTRVSRMTVTRTRNGGMENVIHCVDMANCIKMVNVSSSVVKDKRNNMVNVFQFVKMELCYKTENVFPFVMKPLVEVMENVVHRDKHISACVMMDTAETDVSVVQDSGSMETNVWTLTSVTRSSLAPIFATTLLDRISAIAEMVSSRFLAARMFVRILMNAI